MKSKKEEAKIYTLYVSKREKVIKISKAKKILQYLNYTEEVTRYNDCYYLCSKRKPLVEKAIDLKQEWITKLEEDLKKIKEIEL